MRMRSSNTPLWRVTGRSAVDGLLGEIDPTTFGFGCYELKLSARDLAERIRIRVLADPFIEDAQKLFVTVSLGVAEARPGDVTSGGQAGHAAAHGLGQARLLRRIPWRLEHAAHLLQRGLLGADAARAETDRAQPVALRRKGTHLLAQLFG